MQIAQVVLAPIPGNVTALLGGALFGAGWGFVLSTVGILAGSFITFGLSRRFGKPLVLKFVSEEDFKRYNGFFKGRSLAILLLIFLFPFLPKDAFCFLIGLSTIRFSVFAIAMLVGRTPGILVASLTGAGLINLPWHVWAILAVPAVIVVILSLKHGEKIELWIYKKFKRDQRDRSPNAPKNAEESN